MIKKEIGVVPFIAKVIFPKSLNLMGMIECSNGKHHYFDTHTYFSSMERIKQGDEVLVAQYELIGSNQKVLRPIEIYKLTPELKFSFNKENLKYKLEKL